MTDDTNRIQRLRRRAARVGHRLTVIRGAGLWRLEYTAAGPPYAAVAVGELGHIEGVLADKLHAAGFRV